MNGDAERRVAGGFWPMFVVQASGGLNDNLFKNFAVLTIAFIPGLGADRANQLVILAGVLFVLPFALFSVVGGWLADRYDKARLVRVLKWAELFLMAAGAVALMRGSVTAMLAVTCLTGLQSALFGPTKYAILPQHLPLSALPRANAAFQVSTFAVIVIGTVTAGVVKSLHTTGDSAAALLVLAVALVGLGMAYAIPAAPPPPADRQARASLWSAQALRNVRVLGLAPAVLALAFLWFNGIVLMGLLPGIARDILAGDELTVTWLMVGLTSGVGLGFLLIEGVLALAAVRLKGLQRCLWIGTIMMLLAVLALACVLWLERSGQMGPSLGWLLLPTVSIGAAAGLFAVPLQILMQQVPSTGWRARTIALSNLCNALAMMVASGLSLSLVRTLDYPGIFLLVFALGLPWLFFSVRRVDFSVLALREAEADPRDGGAGNISAATSE